MGVLFSKQAEITSFSVDIEASPETIAKKVVDPAAIVKADHPKKLSQYIIIEPQKAFILETKDGSELVEVLERSDDGMHTVMRLTAGGPGAQTAEEVTSQPLFVVHERWEIEPHPSKEGHTLLKKTWFDFEQKGNWWVPLLPSVRTAAANDMEHLRNAWSK